MLPGLPIANETMPPMSQKISFRFALLLVTSGAFLILHAGCNTPPLTYADRTEVACEAQMNGQMDAALDSLVAATEWPAGLKVTPFTGPDLTPSPATLATAPTGEVYVGVDMMGSLGKDPDRGYIMKFVDCNNDGVVDAYTKFADADNPRGILPLGDKLFVLHTVFSEESGLAEGMDLVVFEDQDRDGIADGPSRPLIEHISNKAYLRERGTDHSTNGIRMGIDGWVYIAVGDFGFADAIDRSGQELTMLGGGIVRVRPDGTGMEVYTHGLRNIYDVAIDPYLNIFTRGNTNDGGGWNVRFIHQIQSGEYGYPVLFKHFTEEILPALVDVGGGSGTGALFLDDDSWPASYNNVPMMADWGRSEVYIHRVTPDGASFQQTEEGFLKVSQVADLDIDASGRMYLAAWDGAGYRGDSTRGYVLRAVPETWDYASFPEPSNLTMEGIAHYLASGSSVARLYAQQELITRPVEEAAPLALEMATDRSLPVEVRIAAMYGYLQLVGERGIAEVVKLTEEGVMQEHALRALTDRLEYVDQVPMDPFLEGLRTGSDRVRVAAAIGLGRLGRAEAAEALLEIRTPNTFVAPARGTEGAHATPNADIILPHVAVQALVRIQATEAVLEAVTGPNATLALWAARYMHDEGVVDGLIQAYEATEDHVVRTQIVTTLARLYQKEAPYDASWWWSTRPDTRGPYYRPEVWAGSETIRTFLMKAWEASENRPFFAELNEKMRLGIDAFGVPAPLVASSDEGPMVDLNEIANSRGQIRRSSIEDVMLALAELEGDVDQGEVLFEEQGCQVCHDVESSEILKGPFMGQIGSIMSRDQIAEAILKPNASISQGFATVQVITKSGESYIGFVSEESGGTLKLRDIAGNVFEVPSNNIETRRTLEHSMMPEGLVNPLSFEEFASLVDYLAMQQ